MPGEMAKLAPSTTVRAAQRASRCPHLAYVSQASRKTATIHASSRITRGIPVDSHPTA
jgi:hypothetical protein